MLLAQRKDRVVPVFTCLQDLCGGEAQCYWGAHQTLRLVHWKQG